MIEKLKSKRACFVALIKDALKVLIANRRVVFFSFILFVLEFVLFNVLQYLTDYIHALQIIAYVLTGIGLGGFFSNYVSWDRNRFFWFCLAFTWLSLLVGIFKILRFPSAGFDNFIISFIFFFPGAYLSKVFKEHPAHKIYFADLFGAGLATFIVFVLYLFAYSEIILIGIALSIAVVGLVSVWQAKRKSLTKLWRVIFFSLTFLSFFALYLQLYGQWFNVHSFAVPAKGLTQIKIFDRHPEYQLLKFYDNLVSRIDVFQSDDLRKKKTFAVAFGGYGNDMFNGASVNRFAKDLRFVFGLMPEPKIFIVGASAQGVIKTAKYMTRPEWIDGIEINPAIYRIMTKDFKKESNGAYEGTNVSVGNAVSYLKNSSSKYDIMVLMNIHTMARISLPGPPDTPQLFESYKLYFERLNRNGYLMIEERPMDLKGEFGTYRIVSTIYSVLKKMGVNQPEKNFFIYSWRYGPKNTFKKHTYNSYIGILVKKTAISNQDRKNILNWWGKRVGMDAVHSTPEEILEHQKKTRMRFNYLSGFIEDSDFAPLFQSLKNGTLSRDYPDWDLSPITQDRPYSSQVDKKYPGIYRVVFHIGGVFLVICLIVFLDSFRRCPDKAKNFSFIIYQILIGIGYILFEVLLLQFYQDEFISPALAFTTLLPTLLIASSIGGYVLPGKISHARALAATLFSFTVLFLFRFQLLDMIPFALFKIFLIILSTGLSGFFMGYFFPTGLAEAKKEGLGGKSSHYFAVNSLAGASATCLSLLVSVRFGLTATLMAAAGSYALAVMLRGWMKQWFGKRHGSQQYWKPVFSCLVLCLVFLGCLYAKNKLFEKRYFEVSTTAESARLDRSEDAALKWPQITDWKPSIRLELAATIQHADINHPKSVYVAPDGETVYANNLYSHNTVVIDPKTMRVKKTIRYDGRACELAVTQDSRFFWVSLAALDDGTDKYPPYIPEPHSGWEKYNFPSVVLKVDPFKSSDEILYRIPVEVKPKIIAISPDEKYVLASNFNSGTVSVISVKEHRVIKTIKVGIYPRGICFVDHGKRAYVANMGSYDISIIDMSTLEVVDTLKNIGIPRHLVATKDGKFIYMSSAERKGTVKKLRVADNRIVDSARVGSVPRTFALSPDEKYLYVVNYRSANISIVDIESMKEVARIPTGQLPIGLSVSPDGKTLWIASFKESKILVYRIIPTDP